MKGMDVPRRMDVIREYRKQGGSVAAVFPIHYSRELLRAFGILPVEVWGPPRVSAGQGAAHLQPYVCSIVQNALSFLHSGGLDVVDLLLVPHACDSLQGLGSILIDFIKPRQPVLTLYIPRGQRDSDVDYLADELRAIYRRLEAITGRSPSDPELVDAIHREEAADALLAKLHLDRQRLPLSDEAFYRLIRSREYLPAETFLEIMPKLFESLSFDLSPSPRPPSSPIEGERKGVSSVARRGKVRGQQRIPMLLSGILPEPMSMFGALAEMGGRVAADDLACCGRRLYPAGQSADPFRHMAERIIGAPPDPTRGSPIQKRLDHLLRLIEVSDAKGVVFYDIKFCEPELFDLPQLRQGLREAGIPSLALEVDINDQLSQPVLNRLAAFLEMIQ
jgi:benzoyl-CoA reductase/2-hydroxyglutaryl-CoA dehydratase subunit BcrC/BadD/HgdB